MSRATSQRSAIWEALANASGPLLPEELLAEAQEHCESLGQATVYRALKRLEEERRVARVRTGDGRVRYEVAQAHHHHFHCRACDRVLDLPGCGLTARQLTRSLPRGYRLEDHEVVLHGLCADCT